MAERDFFESGAKERATAAIKKVEEQTSAEIVITVRRNSGHYRSADLWFGSLCGLASLATMIYSPRPFATNLIPVEVAFAFLAGAIFCANVGVLRRLITGRNTLRAFVDAAAKTCFYDLGITKTQRRTGILIYASLYESRASLVTDVGVDPSVKEALRAIEEKISAAIRARNFAGFVTEVEAIGPALSPAMPRKKDDVNELPDEVQ